VSCIPQNNSLFTFILLGINVKRCIPVTELVFPSGSLPITGSVWLGDHNCVSLFNDPLLHAIISVGFVVAHPPPGVFVARKLFPDNHREFFCKHSFYFIASIIEKVNKGYHVLVHCHEGRSRSPLLLLLLAIHNGVKYSCVCKFYNSLNALIDMHKSVAFSIDESRCHVQRDLLTWKAKATESMSDILRYMGRMLQYAGNVPEKQHTCGHMLKLITWKGSTEWFDRMITHICSKLHGMCTYHYLYRCDCMFIYIYTYIHTYVPKLSTTFDLSCLFSASLYLRNIEPTSCFDITGDNIVKGLIEASVNVTLDDVKAVRWLFSFVDYDETIAHCGAYPHPEIPAGVTLSTGIYHAEVKMNVFNILKTKAAILTYLKYASALDVSMFVVIPKADDSHSTPCTYHYKDVNDATDMFFNPMRVSVLIRPDSEDCRVVLRIQELICTTFGGRCIFSTLLGILGNTVCASPFIYINNPGSIYDSGRCMFSVDFLYFGDPIVFAVYSQDEHGGIGGIPTRWCVLAAGKVLHIHGPNRIMGYSLGHSVLFFYVRPLAVEASKTLHRYIDCENPDIQELSVLCQFVLFKKPRSIPCKSQRGTLCLFMNIIYRVIASCVVAVTNSSTIVEQSVAESCLTTCVDTIVKMICARAPADVTPYTVHTTLMAAKHKEFIKLHTKNSCVNSDFLYASSFRQLHNDNLILLDHDYPFCFYVLAGEIKALIVRTTRPISQTRRVFTAAKPPSQQALELLARVRCTDEGVSYDRYMNLTNTNYMLKLGYEFTFQSSRNAYTLAGTCRSLYPQHPLYVPLNTSPQHSLYVPLNASPRKKCKHAKMNYASPSPMVRLNFDQCSPFPTKRLNLNQCLSTPSIGSITEKLKTSIPDIPLFKRVSKRSRDMIHRWVACFFFFFF
jgi:hypothetical protein